MEVDSGEFVDSLSAAAAVRDSSEKTEYTSGINSQIDQKVPEFSHQLVERVGWCMCRPMTDLCGQVADVADTTLVASPKASPPPRAGPNFSKSPPDYLQFVIYAPRLP